MKKLLLALVATAALAAVASDFPQVVYVSPTGSDTTGDGTSENPYLSISNTLDRAGLAFADDGLARTVVLAAGTYSASSQDYPQDFPAVVPNGVSLKGAGMGATILDGAVERHVLVQANASENAELSGFSLRNAAGRILAFSSWGGVVKDVEIANCTGTCLNSSHHDETLYYNNSGNSRNVVFQGLVMTNINYVGYHNDQWGPPRFFDVEGVGTAVFTNCVFRKLTTNWTCPPNNATGHFYIRHHTSPTSDGISALFVDTLFEDFNGTGTGAKSTDTQYEGGTFYLGRPAGKHQFERCIFRNFNYCGYYKKSVDNETPLGAEQVFCPDKVNDNKVEDFRVVIDNCLFVNINTFPRVGNARAGIVGGFRSMTRVVNCTFHGCQGMAPILAVNDEYQKLNVRMYNSSVSDCAQIARGTQNRLWLYNCNVYNTSIEDTMYNASSANITTEDPHFANAAAGNFHLSDSSTALINKGDNSYVTSWTTDLRDLDGKPRIHGKNGTVDIGCYEKAGLTGLVVLVR